MKADEFDQVRERLNADCEEILRVKGAAYARDEQLEAADRLGNFKRTAEVLGIDPLQVASIFFLKHVDGLLTWVTNMCKEPPPSFLPRTGGESIEGRFVDGRNYLDLLFGLAVERAQGTSPGATFAATFLPGKEEPDA